MASLTEDGLPTASPGCAADSCVICAQLADADQRYFDHLLKTARGRNGLGQAMATSMGFCVFHTSLANSTEGRLAAMLRTATSDAYGHLHMLLERASLQDELIQDLLFNARGRCPACAYHHRIEGRALSRVLQTLGHQTKRQPFPPLCLFHTQSLMRRAEPMLRKRLTRLFRAKTDQIMVLVPSATTVESPLPADLIRLIYPLGRSGNTSSFLSAESTPCPICAAIESGRQRWLSAAIENIRLEQPGWITLPTCHRHLFDCLNVDYLDLRRAAALHYLGTIITSRTSSITPMDAPSQQKRRNRNKWFEQPASQSAEASDFSALTPVSTQCPGCQAETIAGSRAVTTLISKLSRANRSEQVSSVVVGICLKHFAEALIYASSPEIEHRLRRELNLILTAAATR